MPKNPSRKSQGGDVEGETKIDVMLGEAIDVSSASFDAGYTDDIVRNSAKLLGKKLKADLLRGYCDYGRAVGEDPFEMWDKT